MIDLKLLRENPDVVRASQVNRGEDPSLVDQLLEADEQRRAAIQKADELRSEQKAFGKKIGQASPEERPALLEGSNELKAKVKEAEEAQSAAEAKVEELQYKIDNVVEGAPAGGEDVTVILDRKTETHDLAAGFVASTRVESFTVHVRASDVPAPARGDTITIASAGLVLTVNQAPHHTDGGALEWRCPCARV